jgi:hypothetical protein
MKDPNHFTERFLLDAFFHQGCTSKHQRIGRKSLPKKRDQERV